MSKKPGPKNSNNKRNLNRNEPVPKPKAKKRDNIFSKSRDIREDRGVRQTTTSRNPQTSGRGK